MQNTCVLPKSKNKQIVAAPPKEGLSYRALLPSLLLSLLNMSGQQTVITLPSILTVPFKYATTQIFMIVQCSLDYREQLLVLLFSNFKYLQLIYISQTTQETIFHYSWQLRQKTRKVSHKRDGELHDVRTYCVVFPTKQMKEQQNRAY